MTKLLLRFVVRRWIKSAQRSFGGRDGTFNTAGYQCAMRETIGVLPGSIASHVLLKFAGAVLLKESGAHWVYPPSTRKTAEPTRTAIAKH